MAIRFADKFVSLAATAVVATLALTACGSDTPTAASPASSTSAAGSGDTATGGAALGVASSALGQIVVDGKGMSVYMYDKDTQNAGSSSCSGPCAAKWPAVTAESDTPAGQGVTGKIGTIKGVDGKTQVTLNGWPLYYFAGDSKAGDTNGQGVGKIWWVLTADGAKIGGAASSAAPSSAAESSSDDGGY
jgi:predicted lipoprotein with Yx(FWY)xxD motif